MLNIISTACAIDAANPGLNSSSLMSFLPILAIGVIFYFLMIRPQQKKMKDHQAMVEALKVGDRVLTAGGISGIVSKIVDTNEIKLSIAPQVEVSVVRNSLSQVLSKDLSYANNKTEKPSMILKSNTDVKEVDHTNLLSQEHENISQPIGENLPVRSKVTTKKIQKNPRPVVLHSSNKKNNK